MNSDEALGRLSRAWASLEFFWSTLAWTLMDCDQEVGQIVTRRMTFSTLLDTVLALAIHRTGMDSAEVAAIRSAIDKADKVRMKRNDLVHSTWYSDKDGEGFISTKMTRKRGLEASQRRMTVRDVLDVKAEIEEAATTLMSEVLLPYHSDGEIQDISQEEFDEILLVGDDRDEQKPSSDHESAS